MKFSKQNISNYYLYDTQVENLFIAEYMTNAPGDYVKAYLFALMFAQMNKPVDNIYIGKCLDLPPEELLAAWSYWEELGVLKKIYQNPENPLEYRVELLNLREEAFGTREPESSSQVKIKLDNAELAQLYRDVEVAARRPLDSREPEEIASWLSDYGMSPEFILFGYNFCAEKRRTTKYRYVAKVLKDWKSKGLSCPDDISEYLGEMDKNYGMYKQIFRELGFSRSPSREERRIMDTWFEDYGFTLDKILEACKKTSGISNPNINYVDAVLSSWHKEAQGGEDSSSGSGSAVEKLYAQDREQNALREEKIRSEIYAKIPRIKEIKEELSTLSFNISRYMLMGANGREAVLRERARAEDLGRERAELLVQAGYSVDAMDSIYTCSKCRDTGLLEDGTSCSCYADKLKMLSARGNDGIQ